MFGTLAAQLVLDRIAGDSGGPPRRVVLQSDLLVRESCGAKLPTAAEPPPKTHKPKNQ
jgi:DNA-binding LacI/PurR family transcriptional regulator